MQRHLVHLDADAFFASVEQASDARLRGRPIAVGGERRGVISSASYEARQYGIRSAMPTAHARKLCPSLIVLPGDFEKYERFSSWMFSYAYDFTPDVEICSIDEGYFDLSGARRPARDIADTLRRAIYDALKIRVSEGVGSNKLVSQIASKCRKPAGFVEVPPGTERVFLDPLPNRWLPGIGPKAAEKLDAAGLARIGQIAEVGEDDLALLLGRAGPEIRRYARGIDPRPVQPVPADAQSYSRQETFAQDVSGEREAEHILLLMATRLMAKVRADQRMIRTVTVRLRYNDFAEDRRSESLREPTDLETDLFPMLRRLLRAAWQRRVNLRMIHLCLSKVYPAAPRAELMLFEETERREARRELARTADRVRETCGPYALRRAFELGGP